MTQHAVFLSYNSVDHLAVEEIARRLRALPTSNSG